MPTNQYFQNFNSLPQQQLVDDIAKEVIKINGTDVLYLPRNLVRRDDVLNEAPISVFETAFEVEAYIQNTDAFSGQGDIIGKFGLNVEDEITFVIHKERFKEETKLVSPKEGDLIYLYMSKSLFQISFVEHEKPFYSMGKNQVFEITCEKFTYSNEKFLIPAAQMGSLFDGFEREYAIKTALTLADVEGNYTIGEVVSQTSLSTTVSGVVSSFDPLTHKIYLYNVVGGEFTTGENLIGANSATTKNVIAVNDQELSAKADSYDENITFETEGDNILDFSEIDPWAEGDL